jgi:hypothetical protein
MAPWMQRNGHCGHTVLQSAPVFTTPPRLIPAKQGTIMRRITIFPASMLLGFHLTRPAFVDGDRLIETFKRPGGTDVKIVWERVK